MRSNANDARRLEYVADRRRDPQPLVATADGDVGVALIVIDVECQARMPDLIADLGTEREIRFTRQRVAKADDSLTVFDAITPYRSPASQLCRKRCVALTKKPVLTKSCC